MHESKVFTFNYNNINKKSAHVGGIDREWKIKIFQTTKMRHGQSI